MTTSNRWKVTDAGLEGILEGITRRAKGLPRARINRIESATRIDVENKIAEAETKKHQQESDEKNYACQLGSTAEVELFRLAFHKKEIKIVASHFSEYDSSYGYWRRIEDDEIRHTITEDAEKAYWVDDKGKRKGSLATIKNVNSAIAWASNKLYAKIDVAANRDLIAFRNGTVSTKTGHISPHSPNNYLTASIPHDYVENSPCPDSMRRFIDSSFKGQYDYVRACLSLMLDLHAPHKFIHIKGPSGSGKGAFITLLQNIYASTSFKNANTFDIFKDPDKIRQYVSGRRLITVSDITEYIDSKTLGSFYTLVECKPVSARQLHSSDADNEINYTRFIVASTDNLQMASGSSTGLDRRVVPLLTSAIPADQRSESMETELINDIPAIVSWALSMDKDLRDRIIRKPTAYHPDAAEYFADLSTGTSSTWAFINECLEPAPIDGPRQPVQVGYLYSCYKSYCAAANVRAKGLNNWKAELKAIIPQNVVARRFVDGENIPTEWVWINVRRDLFESNGPVPECIISRLGDGGVSEFHEWARKYGSLYPYDRRTLAADLAAMQDMHDMQGLKHDAPGAQKNSEKNFELINQSDLEPELTACPACDGENEAEPSKSPPNGISAIPNEASCMGDQGSCMQELVPACRTEGEPPPGRIYFPDDVDLDEIGELI